MKHPTEIIVYIKDARALHGGCVEGWKTFIESHGFDFKQVVRNGMTAQQLLDTKDSMAIELARHIINRENNNG
jgi:hypothetical protein